MTFVPYVPPGHIEIHSGVRWIARLKAPDLMRRWHEGKPAGQTRRMELELLAQSGASLTDAERSEMADLFTLWRQVEQVITEVREHLLRALMCGRSQAKAVLKDGEDIDIPAARWRTEAGQRVLQHEMRDPDAPIQGRIFINQDDLLRQFGGPATAAGEWMQKNAAGRKREDAIRGCRDATRCTTQVAREAWAALPEDVRGKRGRPKARPR